MTDVPVVDQFWTIAKHAFEAIEQGVSPQEAVQKAMSADSVQTVRDHSVQPRAGFTGAAFMPEAISSYFTRTAGPLDIVPYGTAGRDAQLRRFLQQEGNEIAQATVSAFAQKVQSTEWFIEGPDRTARQAADMVRYSDLGRGFEELSAKTTQDFLTQDNGIFWEAIWDDASPGEYQLLAPRPGSRIIGFAHLDAARCARTGDAQFPVLYSGLSGGTHKLHWKRVIFAADLPSPDEALLGRGMCALSRCLAISRTVIQFSAYRNEMLNDLPPLALLILQNVSKTFWEKSRDEFNAARAAEYQEFFSNFMPMFSMDANKAADAKLIPFKDLWMNFDEKDFWDVAIDLTAMAFGADRQEIAPLATSGLGGGKEGSVLSQKVRGKGFGRVLSTIERQINLLLPSSCTFKFDFQDDEQDQQQANLRNTKISTILSLANARSADPLTGLGATEPIITRDEARQLIAREVPEWSDIIRALPDGISTFSDIDEEALAPADNVTLAAKALRRYGPMTRVYRSPSRKSMPLAAPRDLSLALKTLRGYCA